MLPTAITAIPTPASDHQATPWARTARRLEIVCGTPSFVACRRKDAPLFIGKKSRVIVALDTTRNLIGSFSGLELRLHIDGTALPPGLPGRIVAAEGGEFRVRLANHLELEQALVGLRQAGVAIREMEVHPPDLEEVFLRLTGKAS